MKAMFGFGYNKDKSRAAAEKYLQQNKLQNAVAEYEKILAHEPNDLAVVNTVGDVYSRLGQNEKAIERFRVVAESYAGEGQLLRSIAMFRKIVKLDGNDLPAMEKLAELYRKQGLVNDARAMLLQAADAYTRKNQSKDTLRLLKQLVLFDPENVQVITRTADLLNQSGSRAEAMQMLSQSATTLMMRDAFAPALKVLERLLDLDKGNTRAQELRAQAALQLGDNEKAIRYYEEIADIDSRPDALRNLLSAYLNLKKLEDAMPVARKMASVHRDGSGIVTLAANQFQAGDVLGSLALYDEFSNLVFAADKEDVITHLHGMVSRLRGNPEALQTIYNLLQRSGETSSIAEVLELLAHASVQSNQLERAKKAYKELIELEPGNATHIQGYRQVCARLEAGGGTPAAPETLKPVRQVKPADASTLDEFLDTEEPALPRQEHLPDVEERIVAALSEADLCESYASKARGIQALEDVLADAPDDLRLNRALARLYRQEGDAARAAQCFATIQRVLEEMGETDTAAYYANLSAVDQTTTWESSSAEFSTADFSVPQVEAVTVEGSAEEIDLSDNWDSLLDPAAAPTAKAAPRPLPVENAAELIEEIRFCLTQQFWMEAESGIARLAAAFPGHADLETLRTQLTRGRAGEPIMPMAAPEKFDDAVELIEVTDLSSEPVAEAEPEPEPYHAPAPPAVTPTLSSLAEELEFELGEAFEPVAKPRAPIAPPQPAPPPPVQAAPPPPPPQAAAPVPPPPPPPEPPQQPSIFGNLLQEFESELSAPQEEDGDPETHYNLGIAFREMGLLDEAIGELQKACRLSENGKGLGPVQLQHAYIWLATCFSEKSVFEASVKWYLRALEAATDDESRTAVNYELGNAYEAAGHKQEALDRFMEVYGCNIDYRDVASRIRELRESL